MHTIRYKSYINLRKFVPVAAPRCHPQAVKNIFEHEHQHIIPGTFGLLVPVLFLYLYLLEYGMSVLKHVGVF